MTGGDSVAEVKRILKDYPKMEVDIVNLSEEIAELEAMLKDEPIAAVRFEEERVTGGAGELTATERAAERRIKTEMRIETLKHQIAAIERKQRVVNRAVDVLDELERAIVHARMAGRTWEQVADEVNYSERGARKKGEKAIKDIAFMLFGV